MPEEKKLKKVPRVRVTITEEAVVNPETNELVKAAQMHTETYTLKSLAQAFFELIKIDLPRLLRDKDEADKMLAQKISQQWQNHFSLQTSVVEILKENMDLKIKNRLIENDVVKRFYDKLETITQTIAKDEPELLKLEAKDSKHKKSKKKTVKKRGKK